MDRKLNSQMFRFPHAVRKRWEKYFQEKINGMIMKEIDSVRPDIVLVYNSLYLVPETCIYIKKRAKLVFFMGDSPFYTPQNNYYLACLAHADLILSPDTFWNHQLNVTGLRNTLYLMPGPDTKYYNKLEGISPEPGERTTEVLYVGSCYLNSWGYKKALLMSKFTGFDFQLYGNSAWRRWFQFFPELGNVYNESGFISQSTINRMFNLTKLIPVDGNPGILAGVHLRMFEALASGALPLIEYRNDVDGVLFREFTGELPLIRDYGKAGEIAAMYLRNDAERRELAAAMLTFLQNEYSASKNAARVEEALA